MEIQSPELDPIKDGLAMFCLENRMTRELYWAGFGFQVWCQLLTHIARSRNSSLLVVDEPEVYLHPDVQRQLLSLLHEAGPDVLLATHSTEIMAEADPTEILLIDKGKQRAERLRDVPGVQRALTAVGSIQNITLTALARNRKVVFIEGESDFRLLRRIARKLGLIELSSGIGITSLESGGFGSWQRVTTLARGIEDALGTKLHIASIYDRDFHCEEEIGYISNALRESLAVAHIHGRKEIENYLLIPSVLDRAAQRAANDRAICSNAQPKDLPSAENLLNEITDEQESYIRAQLTERRVSFLRPGRRDSSDIYEETDKAFRVQWANLDSRIRLVPGKEVLAELRTRYQAYGVSLTEAKIVDAMHKDDIPQDLSELLYKLEEFRVKQM
jgi:predicted ATP-dependent endonuclease of OLD family